MSIKAELWLPCLVQCEWQRKNPQTNCRLVGYIQEGKLIKQGRIADRIKNFTEM